MSELKANPYITNNLLPAQIISRLCAKTSLSREWYDFLKQLKQPSANLSERDLSDSWFGLILKKLGWYYSEQKVPEWEGRKNIIDFSLFKSEEDITHLSLPLLFLEVKKWGEALSKAPYSQTMGYIRALQGHSGHTIVYGLLSNGKDWWLCANFGSRQEIARCEIKLFDIIQNGYCEDAAQALALFAHLFSAAYHTSDQAEKDGKTSEGYIEQVKEDIRYIITGLPFENIGKYLFAYLKSQHGADFEPDASCLKDIYHHTLTLAFRLIFQAYIEAKNPHLLDTTIHPTYKNYSLTHFYQQKLGWAKLRKNFHTLDNGDSGDYMPVFNGGLFANKNTPLLEAENLFTDSQIQEIVGQFLFKQIEDTQPVPIDYASLQIKHFSEIYEELLQFEFRIAQGKMYHIPAQRLFTAKNKKIEQNDIFVDCVDYARLKDNYPDLVYTQIPSGSLYFTSKTLSRKVSASYYTPQSLTEFMCRTSIKEALDQCVQDGRSVLDLKILDNACGSGHFLTQALDILFEEVQNRHLLESDARLHQQLEEDTHLAKQAIEKIRYEQPIKPDMVLKRLLLKHCIYGVDMNSFAVEIARASLWLDTFVFGIPLAFIEHHVVLGNSLIGSIEQAQNMENALFQDEDYFPQIQEIFTKINNISDMTAEQAKKSHELYESIRDDLHNASLLLSKEIFERFKNKIEKEAKKKNSTIRLQDPFVQSNEGFVEWFRPFHYWLIFPELWDSAAKKFKGFDIVIGNPPWDKVKFEEPAFFAQYHADYRILNDTQKKDVRQRVLNLPGIQESYELTQSFMGSQRVFMPSLFDLAHGSGGDQNLFRYFIERNLSLLAPQGFLCYLTPSAWSYEQSSTKLRHHIWQYYHTYYFIQFENKGIFQNIHDQYKFACFMLKKSSQKQESIPALFLQHDEFILKRLWHEGLEKLTLAYPVDLIHNTDGQTLLELKSEKDLLILDKIKKNPVLKTKLTQNYIEFTNDFHMTNDVAKHFGEYFFDSPAGLAQPRQLVEAKYFHQFNINHETKDFNHHPRFYDAQQIREYPKLKNRIQELGYCDADYPRLAWRKIASNTNERTAIFCLLPIGSLAGESIWISTKDQTLVKSLFIQAIGNSIILDYLTRQIVDINVLKSLVDTLPFPQPDEEEMLTSSLYRRVIEISALLSLGYIQGTAKEQEMDFLKDFLLERGFYQDKEELQKAIPQTADKRWQLQAQLDILVAKDIYGLSKEEMDYIIPNYFPQWAKAHTFHVNLIEAMWDEMRI